MAQRGIIFDFNRTLYDPTVYALYSGVQSMLEELKAERPLVLFSKKGWDRTTLLKELGIVDHFVGAYFVDKKTTDKLKEILELHDFDAGDTIIVGDMLTEEICAGLELGMKTVWFQQSRFGSIVGDGVQCTPHYIVSSIPELRELLRTV